ncbi:uncharacterized protein [Antedon mediterranea]|uniref:uncharacterized protein n=1 Tax=Antedon mediterranea TaxID=105859 RepID=UPI003AF7A0FB
MAPSQVTKDNEHEVWENLYKMKQKKQVRPKFKEGNKVRISRYKMPFEKGYLANWTEEIFRIRKRTGSTVPTYKLEDWDGEIIEGTFYEKELQKVSKSDKDTYRVEEVIKKRKRGGKTEYFVKWLGYPAKFNSWVQNIAR